MVKKLIISLVVLLNVVLCFAEVPIKYDSKLCKLEIFSSQDIKNRNAKQILEQKVLEFCKDKYIYNIEIAVDNGRCIYIIIYNDIAE